MRIVSRAEWGARDPKAVHWFLPDELPTAELWLHHSADNNHGPDGMRRIQRFHMDNRGWLDIAYSFCVDEDGTIYEARGFGVVPGATRSHNDTSHAICVLGNYDIDQPSDDVLDAIAWLVSVGHARGYWPNRLSGGHRDVGKTSCPGRHLYPLINEINDRVEGTLVPGIYLYARRGTPDFGLASWAVSARPGGEGFATCNLQSAVEAAELGHTVIAVGGPASDDLEGHPHTPVVGENAFDTGRELIEFLS